MSGRRRERRVTASPSAERHVCTTRRRQALVCVAATGTSAPKPLEHCGSPAPRPAPALWAAAIWLLVVLATWLGVRAAAALGAGAAPSYRHSAMLRATICCCPTSTDLSLLLVAAATPLVAMARRCTPQTKGALPPAMAVEGDGVAMGVGVAVGVGRGVGVMAVGVGVAAATATVPRAVPMGRRILTRTGQGGCPRTVGCVSAIVTRTAAIAPPIVGDFIPGAPSEGPPRPCLLALHVAVPVEGPRPLLVAAVLLLGLLLLLVVVLLLLLLAILLLLLLLLLLFLFVVVVVVVVVARWAARFAALARDLLPHHGEPFLRLSRIQMRRVLRRRQAFPPAPRPRHALGAVTPPRVFGPAELIPALLACLAPVAAAAARLASVRTPAAAAAAAVVVITLAAALLGRPVAAPIGVRVLPRRAPRASRRHARHARLAVVVALSAVVRVLQGGGGANAKEPGEEAAAAWLLSGWDRRR